MNLQRFSITLTYDCNSSCRYCNRFLDLWKWKNSDILLADIKEGYKRVQQSGIDVAKVRISGGEPILHPRYEDAICLINDTWNTWPREHSDRQWVTIFTNGIRPSPLKDGVYWKHRVSGTKEEKSEFFWPTMLSPHDMKLEPKHGFDGVPCLRAKSCGRLFDSSGFSFCVFAPVIGRLLGIDPYKAMPVLDGMFEICRHCIYSVGYRQSLKLLEAARLGKIRHPTRTYRKLIRSVKEPAQFPRFLDREY